MKKTINKTIDIIFGIFVLIIPYSLQQKIIRAYIKAVYKKHTPEKGLHFLLKLENYLYSLEKTAAVLYGNGIHPKHSVTQYHSFFIDNLESGERVLDIGCGNGFLSYDMVTNVPEVQVLGIDTNAENIKYAKENYSHKNLRFIHGDALNDLPDERFDVVTLSNVLEHIDARDIFLKTILNRIQPKRIIVRIPSFERDWRVPVKKNLGIDYRLSSTHFIEYTQSEFVDEISKAGLQQLKTEYKWGEIWSILEPLSREVVE